VCHAMNISSGRIAASFVIIRDDWNFVDRHVV
jgi:hypothetical protein